MKQNKKNNELKKPALQPLKLRRGGSKRKKSANVRQLKMKKPVRNNKKSMTIPR